MTPLDHPGRTVFYDELWWVMLLDASAPHQTHMHERFYLADAGQEGCRRVIEDVKKSSAIPMFAIPFEHIQAILARFEANKVDGTVLGEPSQGGEEEQAWLIWLDQGKAGPVIEQWVYTHEPVQAEEQATQRWPGAVILLRTQLSILRQAESSLRHIHHGDFKPIWLDLRAQPRHLSAAELLELKVAQSA